MYGNKHVNDTDYNYTNITEETMNVDTVRPIYYIACGLHTVL